MSKKPPSIDKITLIVVAGIIAIGGIIYELILSTATSYLIGDSAKSYSVGIGLSLFGMGIGSLLAVKLYARALANFMATELILSVLGGTSVMILYAAYALTRLYWLVFVVLTVSIGILIGLEIPLVVRAYKRLKHDQSVFLSRILAADYIGALFGALLFPFVLLPYAGLIRSAIIMGLINVTAVIVLLVRSGRKLKNVLTFSTVGVVLLLVILLIASTSIERGLTTRNFQDEVIYYKTTQYQKIVMTKRQDDTRLYLNNQLQFSSRDEARYHETLVHSAMTHAEDVSDVLIIGGGDGLVAREVLKYSDVMSVTNVDIDKAMTDLAKDNHILSNINQGSFLSPKVQIINNDAQQHVRNSTSAYDVVIVDLVDPANEKVARLFSTVFYQEIASILKPGGVFISQASSTYFTPNAFWIIANNVEKVFGSVTPMNVNVPSFGEWGFVASYSPEDKPKRQLAVNLRYLNSERLADTRNLPAETLEKKHTITFNGLSSPQLHHIYNKDLSRWSY